jgi:predicted transcriptional regulator YheO
MSVKTKPEIKAENALLLREGEKIVEALGKMFAPCCEVILHDLTQPDHSIVAIECPLSGRAVGESVTEMGLARIQNPEFPDIVQNYANTFPDGRPAKSTSIGLRNSEGTCIAAICLNLDISLFGAAQRALAQLTTPDKITPPVQETLRARSLERLRETIETFAAQHNVQPRLLSTVQRRELLRMLNDSGLLHLRNAIAVTAEVLGTTRATIYNVLKASG